MSHTQVTESEKKFVRHLLELLAILAFGLWSLVFALTLFVTAIDPQVSKTKDRRSKAQNPQ
jgi:hypothetical protein